MPTRPPPTITTQSRRELPPRRLLPIMPPATSPLQLSSHVHVGAHTLAVLPTLADGLKTQTGVPQSFPQHQTKRKKKKIRIIFQARCLSWRSHGMSWAHRDMVEGAIGWGCVCHQCRCDALNVLTVETQGERLFVTSLRCDFLS